MVKQQHQGYSIYNLYFIDTCEASTITRKEEKKEKRTSQQELSHIVEAKQHERAVKSIRRINKTVPLKRRTNLDQ